MKKLFHVVCFLIAISAAALLLTLKYIDYFHDDSKDFLQFESHRGSEGRD
ncbi:hypothetical protein OZX74_07835 [Bifidobacterium sp. ESL0798]|nr:MULTISPECIES: hypothetical protein [unclassified Bifidobacterium]WEV53230.1 hypothetical protein OZX64_01670 [Bifidobacterium sp. ESL0704]WEV73791.1 hypothetical protein OZX74_07835 [Bifidobacterium sp. ESL0798]